MITIQWQILAHQLQINNSIKNNMPDNIIFITLKEVFLIQLKIVCYNLNILSQFQLYFYSYQESIIYFQQMYDCVQILIIIASFLSFLFYFQNQCCLTKNSNILHNLQSKIINYMANFTNIILACIFVCALQGVRSQIQKCQNPQYIIPYQPLDTTFDAGIDAIRGKDQLTTLVQDPNSQNAKNYLLSLAPFSAPLFAMAGLTLAIFIATIIQVICFNSCSKGCCGNQINSTTYNVCCMRTMVASFLILCFLTVAISIAALILNSDLQQAIDYTQCNTENIVYEGYNGNNNASMQWSGVNNFQSSINLFSVAIQNNVPFLMTYFSSSNPSFTAVTNTATGSAYANSQIFSCQNSASTVSCPFPNSVQTCPSSYPAQFNSQFCNQSFVGSASNLVKSEMQKNSTSWLTNTNSIASSLTTINTSPTQVSAMVTSVSNFTTSVSTYESTLSTGFDQLDIVQGGISIAFYVFYSFTLAISLLGMTTVCMVYFCKVFKCRYFMYVYWYLFALFALLLFVDSGLFLGGSVAFQDSCLAYPYYFNNVTNFNKLTFSSQAAQAGNIFRTCFFSTNGNTKSIFSGFSDTAILAQFGNLYSTYQQAIPNPTFSSVVSTIQSQFTNYAANPNTVTIEGVANSLQPQTALNQMNLFANFSTAGSTQSCRLTKDYVTFDVINCNLYLTNQAVGQNTCIVLAASNLGTIVTQRVDAFNNKGCTTDANTYQQRINALSTYGNSIAAIAFELAPIQQTNPPTPLQAYQNNYYGYYSSVLNFYNSDIQQIFNGFFNPYNSLMIGSNCGFVTGSMNGIVNIACNQLQAYISSFSVLNIIESSFVFIIFLLAYFLTTRFEFYQFLEGNFANYGVTTVNTKSLQMNYELDSTNRNVELLSVNNSQL